MSAQDKVAQPMMLLDTIKDSVIGISTTPVLIPSHQPDLAVVESCIATKGFQVCSFGVANTESAGTSDAQKILECAREKAEKRVSHITAQILSSTSGKTIDIESALPTRIDIHDSSRHSIAEKQQNYHHSTRHPMSIKQHNLIQKLANETNTSLEDYVKQNLNKPLDDISSSDANQIIQGLKALKKK